MSEPGRAQASTPDPKPSLRFLLPAFAVLGGVVAAVFRFAGWADAMWVSWLGLFVVFEAHALLNETLGDTLSERTRDWFRTKTPAGRVGFIVFVLALASWFIPHILGVY